MSPLVLTRSFPVPPDKVWRAWTDPAAMREWFGQGDAPGWKAQMDVRVGGGYRFTMRGTGGAYYDAYGKYREVVEGRRLVFTWTWKAGDDSEAVITVRLQPAGTGTELEFRLDPVADPRERDAWRQDFDRLDLYLQNSIS
jgi:uncharacterized protein YndB with AHSA1/START domain